MKNNRLLLIAAALSALPLLAHADSPGLYIGLGAGISMPRDSDLDVGATSPGMDLDNGWKGIGSVGYKFTNGVRSELELGYGRNDVDEIGGVSGHGSVRHSSAMANVFYDFDNLMPGSGVTPFVGLGLGAAKYRMNDVCVPAFCIDDDDINFAYQAMAGLNFSLTDQLSANVGYRYFGIPNADLKTNAGASAETEYGAHMVMVGMRWSFGAPARPAPAPAAAPAPAPAPTPAPPPRAQVPSRYLVFFEFDRADLTPEGRQVVQQAATASKTNNVVRIEATGHADRSGSDAYNMRLSQRRAAAVRAELVRNGVRDTDIAVMARGETQPLVPTQDGVREPQNRRVEIVFR